MAFFATWSVLCGLVGFIVGDKGIFLRNRGYTDAPLLGWSDATHRCRTF
jgi:hypothetical protein